MSRNGNNSDHRASLLLILVGHKTVLFFRGKARGADRMHGIAGSSIGLLTFRWLSNFPWAEGERLKPESIRRRCPIGAIIRNWVNLATSTSSHWKANASRASHSVKRGCLEAFFPTKHLFSSMEHLFFLLQRKHVRNLGEESHRFFWQVALWKFAPSSFLAY